MLLHIKNGDSPKKGNDAKGKPYAKRSQSTSCGTTVLTSREFGARWTEKKNPIDWPTSDS